MEKHCIEQILENASDREKSFYEAKKRRKGGKRETLLWVYFIRIRYKECGEM